MNPTSGHHPGRNDPCHCGSGRKYKHCCLAKDEAAALAASAAAADAEAESATAETKASARPPKHQTQQPWKKSAANTRGFHRVTAPRKVGGGG